jgi:5'-nucleotidase (lipoprotein e(P4) family)
MKKLIYLLLAIILILIFSLSATGFPDKSEIEITQKQLNDQGLLAINWVQQSGEYRALTYQAYNLAKIAFDTAINHNILNPAVVLDLDETVLDNSPYQASFIDTNEQFSSTTWNEWIKAESAQAIPGSVDFINYVNTHGGTAFFVSNRNESSTNNTKNNNLEIATINNLIQFGITGVSEETVLLKGEFTKKIDGKENQSKQFRLDAITQGSANGKKQNIVMFIGDNLNDFAELDSNNNQVRKTFIDENKEQQGVFITTENNGYKPACISIPNPMYGYWEYGLYNPEKLGKKSLWDLSPSDKTTQRKQSLIRWINRN